jgi:hypothetical protein
MMNRAWRRSKIADRENWNEKRKMKNGGEDRGPRIDDRGGDRFGVLAIDGKPALWKSQLGKGDGKGVRRSSPGSVWISADWRIFGRLGGSCEKKGLGGASCGAVDI